MEKGGPAVFINNKVNRSPKGKAKKKKPCVQKEISKRCLNDGKRVSIPPPRCGRTHRLGVYDCRGNRTRPFGRKGEYLICYNK